MPGIVVCLTRSRNADGEVVARLGVRLLGRKRLWSRFRSQIGLTPKRAAQLVRFDYAAHLLAPGHAAASVAAQSGYADQSHSTARSR
jgi:methylphosphotriester-DNA--protein-cysteine methyltransferase